jgi:hypothetical protein
MKLANDIFSDKWCFSQNYPTNVQVAEIVERSQIIENGHM